MRLRFGRRIAFVPHLVMEGKEDIVAIMVDYDGDWVCYSATEVPIEEVAVVHRKHLHKLDETLQSVPEIPLGHFAKRERRGAPWVICPPEMTREEWEKSD